ncbi:hypothetical protein FQN53_008639 [Emmonsiellopsis sp. PD_33]|nr:hypothetical protein FQN53_008639 [Emmonsiellopsis sp. PD_33]
MSYFIDPSNGNVWYLPAQGGTGSTPYAPNPMPQGSSQPGGFMMGTNTPWGPQGTTTPNYGSMGAPGAPPNNGGSAYQGGFRYA